MDVDRVLAISIASLLVLAALPFVLPQTEVTGVMNASIQQIICIQIPSAESYLDEGIFFTHKTTRGTQVPITDPLVWHNATHNFYAPGFPNVYRTNYTIQACPSNAVNITICQCPCSDLVCSDPNDQYPCVDGVDVLYINPGTGEGVKFANATGQAYVDPATSPNATGAYYFTGPDNFNIVGTKVDSGYYVWLRYWIDPSPDYAPSGNYTANWTFKGVEYGTVGGCGTCAC